MLPQALARKRDGRLSGRRMASAYCIPCSEHVLRVEHNGSVTSRVSLAQQGSHVPPNPFVTQITMSHRHWQCY